MNQPNEMEASPLLTPIRLYHLILRQLMAYRDQNLPAPLKPKVSQIYLEDDSVEGANITAKATFIKFFDSFGDDVKKFATEKYSKVVLKHGKVVEFMKFEMQDILSAQAGAIKKMTDLSILLHGVDYYMSTLEEPDQFFKMLLDEVVGLLWMGTPDFDAAIDHEAQEVELHNKKELMVIRKMDKISFLQTYQEQIRRVSAFLRGIVQVNPAPNSFPRYVTDQTIRGGLKETLQLEFYLNSNYRCKDSFIPIDTDDLIANLTTGWKQAQHPGLYGGDPLPYLQLAVEVARPVALMGHTYGTFLNSLGENEFVLQVQKDNTDLVSSATKQNFSEFIDTLKPK